MKVARGMELGTVTTVLKRIAVFTIACEVAGAIVLTDRLHRRPRGRRPP